MINGLIATNEYTEFGQVFNLAEYQLPQSILDVVSQLPYCYFYGSRSKIYIPTDNTDSDWDFAVKSDTSPVLLTNLGFKLKELGGIYKDGFTFECWEQVVDGHKVQLVLKANLNLFERIWGSITPEFYDRFLNKRSEHYIGKEWVQEWFKMMNNLYNDLLIPIEDML
jgi:hypothetical protein